MSFLDNKYYISKHVLFVYALVAFAFVRDFIFVEALNVRVLLFGFLALLIFGDIIKAIYNFILDLSLKHKIYISYLFIHTLILALFIVFNIGVYSQEVDISRMVLTGANGVLQLIIIIYIYQRFNYSDYLLVFKFISWLCLLLLLELLFVTVTSQKSISFDPSGHFVSYFLDAEWLVAIFALISVFYYYLQYRLTKKVKYIALSAICSILIGVTMLRAAWISLFFFFFLLFLFSKKITLYRGGFIFLFLFLFLLSYFDMVPSDMVGSLNSIYDRIFLLFREIDLTIQYFPFGVGGGMSEKYFFYIEPITQNYLHLLVDGDSNIVFNNSMHSFNSATYKSSSHNTFLDLMGDYGLIGFVIVLKLSYTQIKIFKNSGKVKEYNYKQRIIVNHSAISVITLSLYYSSISLYQYLWLYAIIFHFMILMSKKHI